MHNLAAVDLNLVVALHALLEERSVTAAARRVGLSQPAMSHALSRLREHFEDPILVRSGRSMTPSSRARSLLEQVRIAVHHLDLLLAPAELDPAALETSIRIVTDDAIGVTGLPALIAHLAAVAPGLELDVLQRGRPGRKALLRQGLADIALGDFSGAGMDLHRQRLYLEEWICVMRPGHPALCGDLTPEVWASLAHVIVSPTGGRRGEVDTALQLAGLERHVTLAVPHFTTALSVVASSDYVCTIAGRVARTRSQDLVLRPPPLVMAGFPIAMLWHARTHHDPVQRWLRSQVAKILGAGSSR